MSIPIDNYTKFMAKHLEKIGSLAIQKEAELEKAYFEKYYPIYELAFQFLKKEKVLAYGGYAINEILPKESRFYGDAELPDIDVFCPYAKTLSEKAVRFFKRHGFLQASSMDALHENTFKVMVSGLQVLDITHVSKKAYENLKMYAVKTSHGIWTTNPQFLRMTLHMLLSQPVDIHRWTKIFERLVAFYKAFPPSECSFQVQKSVSSEVMKSIDPAFEIIENVSLDWVRNEGYVVFSPIHIVQNLPPRNTYVARVRSILPSQAPLEVLVDTANKSLESIAKEWYANIKHELKNNGMVSLKSLKVSKVVNEMSPLIPPYVYIYYDKKPVVGLLSTSACVSYVAIDSKKSIKMASIQTLLRTYLQMWLSKSDNVDLNRMECIMNLLSLLSIRSIMSSRNPLLRSFVLTCYGSQPGMATLKRERYERKKK